MPSVAYPDGREIGDVTDPQALAYYRAQGYLIDGVAQVTPPVDVIDDAPVVDDATFAGEPVDEEPPAVDEVPAVSALKSDWVDYALKVDPGNAAEIDAMTKDELIAAYGE